MRTAREEQVDKEDTGEKDKVYVHPAFRQPESPLDRLKKLAANARIEEMEKNLSNEYFIFEDMALAGVITLFYAWPNTGKTLLFLRFLIDAIDEKRVLPEDIFYINADDNYKGLYTKTKIAEEYGFFMVSPQEAGVSAKDVLDLLTEIAQDGDAQNKVFLLDTLKKFADMMDKRAQAALYEVLRILATKGATIILAGHANKHPDADGNMVYEGTADTMNDVDCAYAMYRMSDQEDETQIVEFRRQKDRGDIVAKASYKYKKISGMHYKDIIKSISRLDSKHAAQASRMRYQKDLKERYESEILFVLELIKSGPRNQNEIIQARKDGDSPLAQEISERTLREALKRLEGICWDAKRGDRNAKLYSVEGYETGQYRAETGGK